LKDKIYSLFHCINVNVKDIIGNDMILYIFLQFFTDQGKLIFNEIEEASS